MKKYFIIFFTFAYSSFSGLGMIYLALIVYPNFIFAHSLKYKNFNVYSTEKFSGNMQTVLDKADKNLSSSEIYAPAVSHDIYLCNSYTLYSFLAPATRHAFACNYPFINNIFIAKCEIDKNEAYIDQTSGWVTRKLHELISHEVTHTLIEKKLGFWKYRSIPAWKNEGYCEYIGFNNANGLKEAYSFVTTYRNDYRGGAMYRKYYYAVTFLKKAEQMSFDDIVASDLTFEEVLKKIEHTKEK
jgi:hypothetical protein